MRWQILIVFFEQVSGNENPSVLIAFASKTLNAGQVISKLHVIELGAQPGLHIFTSSTSISHALFYGLYGSNLVVLSRDSKFNIYGKSII
jgi:hypothetical protein